MSDVLNHKTLSAQLNTKFTVADAPESFKIELVEITEPTATASQTFFSLYFFGGEKFQLPQGTFRLQHEKLGELFLFLVPVGREPTGYKYEAVFNLLNEGK